MTEYQAVRASSQSSQEIEETQFKELFEAITLSAEQETRARAVIHEDNEARRELVVRTRERWSEQFNMVRRRDCALQDLLTAEPDKARFERNAAAQALRRAEGIRPRR